MNNESNETENINSTINLQITQKTATNNQQQNVF